MSISKLRSEWFGNIRSDIMAGTVVALALIPETIAFSIIAGVDPKVGFYGSFVIAIAIAFVGGRPGMISSTAGAMSVLMVNLVKQHGIEHLFAATILTGILQVLAGYLRFSYVLRFVSKSVTIGFLNALAILLFLAQLPAFDGAGYEMFMMVAFGLGIIYLFPFVTKLVPSTLVCIILLTVISLLIDLNLKTIGDMGELPSIMPSFIIPDVPFSLETFYIILPYSATLAMVGLLESLMTSVIIDDLTDTPSCKNKESRGQGIANILAGFFGGMAGCALIGQSIINVKSGGRTRLSVLYAGSFLMFMIMTFGDFVKQIPLAALVAVMVMVSISTFEWSSIFEFRKTPVTSNIVVFTTIAVVVFTHDLAQGVLVGVILSAIFFVYKVSNMFNVTTYLEDGGERRVYKIEGQIFFASAAMFGKVFDIHDKVSVVTINLQNAHFWDVSAVEALERAIVKIEAHNKSVQVIGMNEASSTIYTRVTTKQLGNA